MDSRGLEVCHGLSPSRSCCAAAAVLGLACTVSPAAFRVAHPGQPAPAAGQHANFNSDGFDDLRSTC
jgi:hypothetical protein